MIQTTLFTICCTICITTLNYFSFIICNIFCTTTHLGLSKSMEAYLYGQRKAWKSYTMLPDLDILDTQDMVVEKAKKTTYWKYFSGFIEQNFTKSTPTQEDQFMSHKIHIKLYKTSSKRGEVLTKIHL